MAKNGDFIPCVQVLEADNDSTGYLLRDFHDAPQRYWSWPVLQPKRVKVSSNRKDLQSAAVANLSTQISALGSDQ